MEADPRDPRAPGELWGLKVRRSMEKGALADEDDFNQLRDPFGSRFDSRQPGERHDRRPLGTRPNESACSTTPSAAPSSAASWSQSQQASKPYPASAWPRSSPRCERSTPSPRTTTPTASTTSASSTTATSAASGRSTTTIREMELMSPDPADPAATTRVLTVMLADEY